MNFLQKSKSYSHVLSVVLLSVFLLSCEQASIINETVMRNEQQIEQAISTISPDGNPQKSLKVDNSPWYGAQAVPIRGGRALPSSLDQSDSIVLTFSEGQPLYDTARMIQSVSGIRVSLSNNIYDDTLGAMAARTFLPTDGQEVSGGRILWSGRLSDLLDQVANNYGAEWSYDGAVITLSTEVTKTFMLNALANVMTITGAAESGGTSNIPELSVDGTTTLAIWDEVTEAVERIIGDQGQASFSPTTGTITITSRPDVAKRVETYLRYQNEKRLRRIAVSVKVLSVQTSDTYTYGTDITGVIKSALGGGYSVNGTSNGANGLSLSLTKATATAGDVTSTLTADENIDRASVVHSGSIVTLSDQVAPLQVARQIAYLERVSSSGDAGSVSLEPGTVDLGLFMTVLPRIVEDDKILMRMSIAITDADPNFRSFGTDEVQIELPEVETTGFLQNAVVSNGETMVLAGFEKSQSSLGDDGLPHSLIGGTRSTSRARDLTVLLINAQILPEQPLTVIGR
jgi:type IVB pilus formation R64 PilN family outer membrane protein